MKFWGVSVWKLDRWKDPWVVSGFTVSQETGRLTSFGHTLSAPWVAFPPLLSVLVPPLKNVYFDFVFCWKNPSVNIGDLLSPGDPHNCTYFDIYTHLGRGVPVYHYACRLPTGHSPEIRTVYLYVCPYLFVSPRGDASMNNFSKFTFPILVKPTDLLSFYHFVFFAIVHFVTVLNLTLLQISQFIT